MKTTILQLYNSYLSGKNGIVCRHRIDPAKLFALVVGYILITGMVNLPFSALAEGIWPTIRLPVPERSVDRQYLGLSEGDTFSLADIKADIIVVQIYSMYCPICQREATEVNSLFEMILARKDIAGKTKLLAIGAGNSAFEVQFYRTTYNISYPLFADAKFKLHQKLGEVGTPYYYILKKNQKGALRQVYAKAGAFESPERFFDLILKRLGE